MMRLLRHILPQKEPQELAKNWRSMIRGEIRKLERQIQSIELEGYRAKELIRNSAATGQLQVCHILAKEVVRARKTVKRIYVARAKLSSVENSINQQLSMLRITGSLQKSTEMMKEMQELIKISEVAESMREMSREMMKAGIIEDMTDEAFESVGNVDELEEDTVREVDQILWDLTAGRVGKDPNPSVDQLPCVPSESPTLMDIPTEMPDRPAETSLL